MITPYEALNDIIPFHPAVIDIETRRSDGTEFLVTFAPDSAADATDRPVYSFQCWEDFWVWYIDYVIERKYALAARTLYAHYGGGFDFPHLLNSLEDMDIPLERVKIIMAEGIFIGCDIRVNKRIVIHLRDSIRMVPGSLEKLTKAFDVEHKKINIGGQIHDNLAITDPILFQKYAEHDVLGLQEVLLKFWELLYDTEGSVGKLAMTIPGMSLRMFRKQLEQSIWVTTNPEVKALERRAYTGGRTECFKMGKTVVNVYDVNSLYPSVMRDLEVPIDYAGGWTTEYTGQPGFYHIRYTQGNRHYPPLLRDEQTKEFRYCGEGVYSHVEIDKLRTIDGTFEVIRGYRYFRTEKVFKGFIDKWYNIRLAALRAGNDGLALVCKLLMNSLYGKFGQREEGWTIYRLPFQEQQKLIEQNNGQVHLYGSYAAIKEDRFSEYTFVAIAAMITSAARVRLYEYMQAAIDAGGVVWYVDTDSVHVSGATLPSSDLLGEMKHEYAGAASYAGKKLYTLHDNGKVVHKGVKLSAGVTTPMIEALAVGAIDQIATLFTTLPTPREVFSGEAPAKNIVRSRTLRRTGQSPST